MQRDCDKECGPSNTIDMTSQPEAMACREPTFREILVQRIDQLHQQLAGLERLSDSLPLTLPHHADRAMRNLLCKP